MLVVACAGPPWVIESMSGKVRVGVSSTVVRTRNIRVGVSIGRVIQRRIWRVLAPSTRAASS
ncbi:Uncharacterised protein [Mycobacteroides abscessus subsp. abscessus]|nr:Uncharacterised protein [Mycobacteroides abscessus subsp. abscessus]